MKNTLKMLTTFTLIKFLFAGELVILGNCDEFILHKEIKISSVFSTLKVYCACVLEVYDFFHKLGAFFTSREQMKEPVLGRSSTTIFLELTSWQ